MPFGPFESFAACVAANQDKDDPEAYCAALEQRMKERIIRTVPIAKVDDEERLVFGVVYEPDVPDAHGDAMTGAEIRKMAHNFLRRYAQLHGELGTDHRKAAERAEVVPIESFIAPVDFQLGTQQVRKGSWLLGAKVLDEQIWKDVKAGKYTGWSFEGWGQRRAA